MEKYWIQSGNDAMKAKAEESKKVRLEAKKLQEALALDNQMEGYWANKPAGEDSKEEADKAKEGEKAENAAA